MSLPIRGYSRKGRRLQADLVEEKNKLDRLHNLYLQRPPSAAAALEVATDYAATNRKHVANVERYNELVKELAAIRIKMTIGKKELQKKAEAVLKAHGRAPIQIDGVVYDFGCTGEVVYLIRRGRQK